MPAVNYSKSNHCINKLSVLQNDSAVYANPVFFHELVSLTVYLFLGSSYSNIVEIGLRCCAKHVNQWHMQTV